MAIGQKYINITNFLQNSGKEQIRLTFEQMEAMCPIPKSAYTSRTPWRNSGLSFSSAWMNAGYGVCAVKPEEQWVEFVKGEAAGRKNPRELAQVSPETANELLDGGLLCLESILKERHHLYRPWEHCFRAFSAPFDGSEERLEDLSLQLAWYLGTCGVLRNGVLQDKDYEVQLPVVRLVMDSRWDCLRGLPAEKLREEEPVRCLLELAQRLGQCYEETAGRKVTDAWLTSVLLGTLGCVPVYDRAFKAALRKTGAASSTFGKRSLMQLGSFYSRHAQELEALRSMCPTDQVEYPQALLLAMCFSGYDTLHG